MAIIPKHICQRLCRQDCRKEAESQVCAMMTMNIEGKYYHLERFFYNMCEYEQIRCLTEQSKIFHRLPLKYVHVFACRMGVYGWFVPGYRFADSYQRRSGIKKLYNAAVQCVLADFKLK